VPATRLIDGNKHVGMIARDDLSAKLWLPCMGVVRGLVSIAKAEEHECAAMNLLTRRLLSSSEVNVTKKSQVLDRSWILF